MPKYQFWTKGSPFLSTIGCVSYFDLHLEIYDKAKFLTKLYDKRDDFYTVLSPFLSSVTTSLLHLRTKFSFQNSNIMQDLAVTFCFALNFLFLGFWNRVMLPQYWSHYYRCFVVVIVQLWFITMFPSAPWKLICSMCHSFLFLFRLPWTSVFMSNSTGAPGPCS